MDQPSTLSIKHFKNFAPRNCRGNIVVHDLLKSHEVSFYSRLALRKEATNLT